MNLLLFMVEEILRVIDNQRRSFSGRYFFFNLAVVIIAFLISCAMSGKNCSTLDAAGRQGKQVQSASADTQKNAPITATGNCPSSTASVQASDTADDSDTLLENPDDLIETAKQECSDGNYAAADSNLKRAVKAIESIDADNADEEWLPASRYLQDIVSIYTDKMPQPYSVPEDITMAAFQNQMVRSLDSLKVMPSDSLALIAKMCQKDLSYDVPMVWNERVQRALFFYINNRDITIDRWFNKALYYLPVMRKMFADSGLPLDLAYLPLIESGFNPLAYSYAHASGIWQFISSTGSLYGLRHSYWIDERRDPLRATQAAILYLKKLYNDFGNWHLALAAYNCGENGVSHAIKRSRTNDYWKLPLPNQTRGYVPFYLAAVTIAKNPKCFNVVMPPVEPFALDTVLLNDCLVLNDIADSLNIPLDTLKKINPHIMRWCTPPDVSNTVLYLPKGQKTAFYTFYAKLPEAKKVKWCRYLVKPNDNIQKIAKQYKITVECLAAINHLKCNNLAIDRNIFIPMPVDTATTSVAFIPPESHDDDDFSDMTTYRVRKGDNLGKIARRFHVPLSQLYRLNRLSCSSVLSVGRVLVVRHPPAPVAEPSPPVLAVKPPQPSMPDTIKQTAIYVVQQGDTPFSIAHHNSIALNDLIAWNKLDEKQPVIHNGDTLKISNPAQGENDTSIIKAVLVLRDTSVSGSNQTRHDSSTTIAQSGKAKDGAKTVIAQNVDSSAEWSKEISDSAVSGTGTSTVKVAEKASTPVPRYYKMKKGDNLFRVSLAFSVPLPVLLTANNLTRNSIVHTGDSVRIPDGYKPNAPKLARVAPETKIVFYKVKSGDTLWRIASSLGVSIEDIYKQNNLKPDSVLVPGKVIKVIKGGPM